MHCFKCIAVVTLCLTLAGCGTLPWPLFKKTDDTLYLQPSSFDRIQNWSTDNQSEAIAPLQKSCALILKKDPAAEMGVDGFAGTAGQWQEVCNKLSTYLLPTDNDARQFFQDNFIPYEVRGARGREGLFTGYYEPTLHGSRGKHGKFRIPIYGRPHDLISVSLGDFKPLLKGETIMGRVQDKKLVPYYKRAEIEKGALKKQRREIAWVDNAVDAFFLHIQGSGQIVLDNHRTLHVGYAAENGQPYMAIGQELIRRGALTKDNVSMQSIREWLEQHPEDASDVMNLNTSYIFFSKLADQEGPLGAEGVPLTPRRSIAVDRKKIPYGVPLWLEAEEPDNDGCLQLLMIAQDTGGAITGSVRGDFFWGAGEEAEHKAGLMKSRGHSWLLLPKSVTVPKEKLYQPLWMSLQW
ncbi:MAG: MltA domain-containing protein [Proteobacteria bacterium]|nr:MltA domain-containing protein [Pseudomonadota bacterium]